MRHLFVSAVAGIAALGTVALADTGPAQAQDAKQLRWATSSTGSSGHRALVALSTMLNDKFDGYDITVLPTPGAAASLRGFAAGQFDGYYGADVAFHEIEDDTGRYVGFKEQVDEPLVQSFWAYTLEVGLGVRADDAGEYKGWSDLSGKPVFTGPAPWDTRAALERAMKVAGVEHEYIELDKGLAGSALQEGTIDGFIVYTAGQRTPSPWVTEAMLATDVSVLNPNEEELAKLKDAGIAVVDVDKGAFDSDIGVDTAKLVPFFYGFHVGLNVPEDDVYRMLNTIKDNAAELAEADAAFSQIADNMVEMQVRGIEAAGTAALIHPGLARFLRENDAWNEAWNDRIAQ